MNLSLLLISAIVTFVAIKIVLFLFPKLWLLDDPQKYGHKRSPVPYPAGIIIPLIFFALCFFLIPQNSHLFHPFLGFACASLLLLITSFIDDRRGLPAFLRLAVQFIVAFVIIASGIGIDEIRAPFGGVIALDTWTINFLGHQFIILADILAILWIVGMINAMNWLDGVSGLTSSVSAISATVLAVVAYFFGQNDMAMIFGVLAVICFVFLFYDIDSPKILMGDSGSMFLGLALAVFTIIAGGKLATALIVMFVPLFDAVWTIARRIYSKQSPFKGDLCHLHHKLISLLKSRKKVVILYASTTAFFGLFSILLETQGKILLLVFLCVSMFFLELYLSSFDKKM
ncbi:undecaprenyl/decaprenyl-phosphate alpha-N-acetylglucosaminyl 1-phosphate transferase [Candidatus Peregrinibacteria bacterium]|nr:undecaprenyl/decaprenyl-phosphate alpha-N-acetylglucosaminyl 1-phosphate transferase [Candidatus Peregrinibacteria bacterium]